MTTAQKNATLQKYGLSTNDLIHKGMEAEVYSMGTAAVLKLYPGAIDLQHLTTLQKFYASLPRSALSYSVPEIQTIAVEGDICISTERRLAGV